MRAFITGSSGFVGGYLGEHLRRSGDEVFVLPEHVDVAEPGATRPYLEDAAPEVIYHLAALTHVGRSWEEPSPTWRVNVLGTVELLEAAKRLEPSPRVVLVSSSEVYGRGEGAPLDEDAPVLPVTPYAASKAAAEVAAVQAGIGRGLEVVRVRPFNHIGPGQADAFVISALAKRIIESDLAGRSTISVGNLAAERDFTDVRDVIRAYRELARVGVGGEVYNVCSGTPRRISFLLERLVELSGAKVEAVSDPELFRPVDVERIVGSAAKLEGLVGWRPEISIDETLSSVLEQWRKALTAA